MSKTKTEAAAEWVDINSITPWADNPRNNGNAVQAVAESIKRFGFASPIIARAENREVIAGHTRLLAAQSLGLDLVPVRFLDLDPADAKLLAIADNRIGEIAEWDESLLSEVLDDLRADDIDISMLGFTDEELSDLLEMPDIDENIYTRKVESPVYEITGECPDVSDLTDNERTNKLISDIQNADIDASTRAFLISAANRHTVFSYKKIAEFYAHASADVQTLMEDSALIIIDYDKAVELGYIKLLGGLEVLNEAQS